MEIKNDLGIFSICFIVVGIIVGTVFLCMLVTPLDKTYKIDSFVDSIYYETVDEFTTIEVKNIYNFKQK